MPHDPERSETRDDAEPAAQAKVLPMHVALEEAGIGAVWPALRALRAFLARPDAAGTEQVWLHVAAGGCGLRTDGPGSGSATPIRLRPAPLPDLDALPVPIAAALRLYLPVLLGAHEAARAGRAFVTAHLAQSLDGRIACSNGHSQWISNEANLRHAHRLRALHDAVLVGRRTVTHDDPQLTVRFVEGEHPRRVVLNASGSLLAEPRAWRTFTPPGALLLCAEDAPHRAAPPGVEVLRLRAEHGLLPPDALLGALAARGLRSIFVEGGARTLSAFVTAGRVDLLHLHIAPLLLGSGLSGFTLPEITRIQQARRYHVESFGLDGELLLACRPDAPG